MVHRTMEQVEHSAEPLFRPHPLPLKRGQNRLTAVQCWWPQTLPQRPMTSTLAPPLIPLTPPHSARWFEEMDFWLLWVGPQEKTGWVSMYNELTVWASVVKCKYGCSFYFLLHRLMMTRGGASAVFLSWTCDTPDFPSSWPTQLMLRSSFLPSHGWVSW